jgi:hypothetical protein
MFPSKRKIGAEREAGQGGAAGFAGSPRRHALPKKRLRHDVLLSNWCANNSQFRGAGGRENKVISPVWRGRFEGEKQSAFGRDPDACTTRARAAAATNFISREHTLLWRMDAGATAAPIGRTWAVEGKEGGKWRYFDAMHHDGQRRTGLDRRPVQPAPKGGSRSIQ